MMAINGGEDGVGPMRWNMGDSSHHNCRSDCHGDKFGCVCRSCGIDFDRIGAAGGCNSWCPPFARKRRWEAAKSMSMAFIIETGGVNLSSLLTLRPVMGSVGVSISMMAVVIITLACPNMNFNVTPNIFLLSVCESGGGKTQRFSCYLDDSLSKIEASEKVAKFCYQEFTRPGLNKAINDAGDLSKHEFQRYPKHFFAVGV
uniref:Uncharacterized protein n=1 Tax=Romanomermis culicivorax TaxID=13658 RepID=A0A915JK23_ROMCU